MDAALELNKAEPAIRRLNLKLQLYFYSLAFIFVIAELKKN